MSTKELPVLINSSAQSVPADAEQQIRAFSAQCDINFDPIHIEPEDMIARLEDASEKFSDVAIWGGDGTVACALKNTKSATRILPLPGGTMNLLHKTIHGGDQSPEYLLNAYAKGTLAQSDIPVARVNGHEFYVGVICGHIAELASVREALRRGEPLTAMSELFGSNSFDLSNKLEARFQHQDMESAVRNDVVALAAFLRSEANAPLEVGVLNVDTVFEMTTTALEALLEGWENASSIDSLHADKINVSSPQDEIAVTIDGELHHLRGPLVIEHDNLARAKVLACPTR